MSRVARGHLHALLTALLVRGRRLSATATLRVQNARAVPINEPLAVIMHLCRKILSGRGEASTIAIASEILRLINDLTDDQKTTFFQNLATSFGPDWPAAREAWHHHEEAPTPSAFRALTNALEPRRQELFRLINRAPGATAMLVRLRADLQSAMAMNPELIVVDDDLSHLLHSWFNRGFLVMQRINWSTSADLLEQIIRYEAVHQINTWDELRRRLRPLDRRCYAFFHPAMADEPLIFVEVALCRSIPSSIQELLSENRQTEDPRVATTATFYSINNCQAGLQGISFGSFLIKQVVEDLSRELPALDTFVTLSPIPGFRKWAAAGGREIDFTSNNKEAILTAAADYLLNARDSKGRAADPVARFHLGNGARLERLCWKGDTSVKGQGEAAGLMVNYFYDLANLEVNHEAFVNNGTIAASDSVARLASSSQSLKDMFRRDAPYIKPIKAT